MEISRIVCCEVGRTIVTNLLRTQISCVPSYPHAFHFST